MNCRKEPVCLICSGGLVNVDCRKEPVHLICTGGLVKVSNWALGAVALVAFKPSGDIA